MSLPILLAFIAVPGLLGLAIARRCYGTAIGIVTLIALGVFGTALSMLQDLSETPDNSVGNPRRVHVRNESSETIYVVARDRLVEDRLTGLQRVRPGELVVIRGMFHPADRDRACTDEPMALVQASAGAIVEQVNGSNTLEPGDAVVRAELAQCFPMGRNIVIWDGRAAFVDPDARPPRIDPGYALMVYGWASGTGALLIGATVDIVNAGRRRRRSTAGHADWPPPPIPPAEH